MRELALIIQAVFWALILVMLYNGAIQLYLDWRNRGPSPK